MVNRSVTTGQSGDIVVPGDYLGLGKPQIAVFRPSTGYWYINSSSKANWGERETVSVHCGQSGDIPVPADFFGEGRVRIAVFRPSTGTWHINGSNRADWGNNNNNISVACGQAGDIPVPADFFGEGRARIAVFRPSTGTWHINGPQLVDWGNNQGHVSVVCGQEGDVPVPADYFGERRARIAVFRPTDGTWYINGSNTADWGRNHNNVSVRCGQSGDIPVPADYHGSGHDRIAVFRPSNGTWYVNGSNNAHWENNHNNVEIRCGSAGDIPVALKKNKQGKKARVVAFRPSTGHWHIKAKGLNHW